MNQKKFKFPPMVGDKKSKGGGYMADIPMMERPEDQLLQDVAEPDKSPHTSARTAKFKADLQETVSDVLGRKVSKQLSWQLYKAIMSMLVNSVLTDGRLPLQGIGIWEIIEVVPRGGKVETHNFVPKFKFRPGLKIERYLENTIAGVFKQTETEVRNHGD